MENVLFGLSGNVSMSAKSAIALVKTLVSFIYFFYLAHRVLLSYRFR